MAAQHRHLRFSFRLWLTLGLFVTFTFSFALYVRSEKEIDRAHELRYRTNLLADELRQSSDDLTRSVRSYVVTGAPVYKACYQQILDIRDGKRPKPANYKNLYWELFSVDVNRFQSDSSEAIPLLDLIRQAGVSDVEFSKLKEAKTQSDLLTATEREAIRLAEAAGPNGETQKAQARSMLFDERYHQAKAAIMRPIAEFDDMVDHRTFAAVQRATYRALVLRSVVVLIGSLLALMVWLSYHWLRQTLGGSIEDVRALILHIRTGDFSVSEANTKAGGDNVLAWLSETRRTLGRLEAGRKSAECELNRAWNRYVKMLAATGDGFWLVDAASGRLLDVNAAAVRMSGYSREVLLSMQISDLDIDHDSDEINALRGQITLRGGALFQTRHRTKDGRLIDVEVSVTHDPEDGTFIAFLRDITERKQAEKAFQESKIFLQCVLDSLPSHIAVLDHSGTIVATNAAWQQFSLENGIEQGNQQPVSHIGLNYLAACGPDASNVSDDTPRARIQAVLDGRLDTYSLEYSCHAPWEQRWYMMVVNPLQSGRRGAVVVHTNISARKEAEEALRESEQRYRELAEHIPVGIYSAVVDLSMSRAFRMTFVSERLCEITGLDRDALMSDATWAFDLAVPEDQSRLRELSEASTKNIKPFFIEGRFKVRGETRWLSITSQPRILAGEMIEWNGVVSDITDRKWAEAELQEARECYRRLVEDIGADYLLFSHQTGTGILNYVSPSIETIFGISRDEVMGKPWMNAVNWLPGSVEKGLDKAKELLEGGKEANTVEMCFRHPDGTPRDILVTQHLVRDSAGQPEAIEGLVLDITERKRTQAELEEYRQHLEQLVETRTDELERNKSLLEAIVKTTPNGVLLIDYEGKICMTNNALDRMFGYTETELIDHPLEDLVPVSMRERHREQRQQFVQNPQTRPMGFGLDLFGQRKDGSCFPIDVSLAAFSVNEEQYVQATVADITARKLAEEALRDLNANLEYKVEVRTAELAAASAAKSEFLANMSHEIRTPMNGILGLAQLLEREPLSPDQYDMVKQIRNAGQLLLGILNDILDFSKIEAGQLQIDPQPFTLPPMLAQLESMIGSTAHAKGVAFYIEVPSGLTGLLIGDALRVEQILINLTGNAVKFTEQGEIRVHVQTLTLTETTVRLRFEVRDTGIGIAPDHLSTLFNPFTQADGSISRRFGGTGLGLSICKRLVELMGGEIGVESRVGVGSTFWFELPFKRSFEKEAQTAAPSPRSMIEGPRLSGLHCLIVDDSLTNRDVVERTLIREGARATLAVDGQQALQYLQAQGDVFDVVLMDVQMPVMDGLTATRAIRDKLGFKDLPVIAITAGVLPEQREQARAAGCNDFVAKPVDLEQLVAVLIRWTSLTTVSPPSSVEELPDDFPDIPGLDIQRAISLLGDDRDFFLKFLKNFVAEFGTAAKETREYLARGDRESAVRQLHTLRGAAGYLGAVDLVQSAQVLEVAIANQGPDLDPLITAFDQRLAALLKASEPWRK